MSSRFEHRYGVAACPRCGNDLTAESGVTLESYVEAHGTARVPSRLAADGTLCDAFDIIENGHHSGTLCGACGEDLSAYEREAAGPAVVVGIGAKLTHRQMDAIRPAEGWDDGRKGCLWCRFDAMVSGADDPRNLRAEVTWDDNDAEAAADRVYYAPELRLETNDRVADGRLRTRDAVVLTLTNDEAVRIVAASRRASWTW